MNLNLTQLFPKSAANVEVIAGRDMIVTVPDGTQRSVTVGDRFEVTKEELARYERGDLLVQGKPASTKMTDPAPSRPPPTPAPDAWRDLPKSFTQWHDLNDRFRCLRQHLRDIAATRVRLFGSAIDFAALRGGASAIGMRFVEGRTPQENHQILTTNLDFNCPKTIFNDRCLTAAHDAATDELERLTEKSEVTLQRLFLECGSARLVVGEQLQAVVEELADLGLRIFETRVAALALSQHHVRGLFFGSADWQKYVHPDSYRAGMAVLRVVDGRTEFFVDESPEQSASVLSSETLRLAELKPLLLEARKTLAKTLKLAA